MRNTNEHPVALPAGPPPVPSGPVATRPRYGAASNGIDIPAPLAAVPVRTCDGATIVLRRHGNPDGPRLVISHGNGLSADAYYPFWSLLENRFDLVLYDFRNHGWNPVGDRRAHQVETFVRDNACVAAAIDESFGRKPRIGVFHSTSALTAILPGAERHGYSALVLFDPPILHAGRGRRDVVAGERLSPRLAGPRSRSEDSALGKTGENVPGVARVPSAALGATPCPHDSRERSSRPVRVVLPDWRGEGLRGTTKWPAGGPRSVGCPAKVIVELHRACVSAERGHRRDPLARLRLSARHDALPAARGTDGVRVRSGPLSGAPVSDLISTKDKR